MSFHLETEKDVERLRQAALLLEAENRRLVARVVELTRKLMSAQGKDAEELQRKHPIQPRMSATEEHGTVAA